MKTRQDLRSEIHKALANFYQDLDFVKDGDRAGVDYMYSIHTTIITHKCEEYFNFEKESARVMPKKEDKAPFAILFETKLNNWICGVLLSVCGLIALLQVLRYAGILNLNF